MTVAELVYKELAKAGCKHCLGTGRFGFRDGQPIPCQCARKEHARLAPFAAKLPNVAMDAVELVRAAKAASEVSDESN